MVGDDNLGKFVNGPIELYSSGQGPRPKNRCRTILAFKIQATRSLLKLDVSSILGGTFYTSEGAWQVGSIMLLTVTVSIFGV